MSGGTAAWADEAATPADEAAPIPPLPEPAAWDREVDVVVAGAGSGLAAALRAAELGASVACFEANATWGGTSTETDIFAVVGSAYQEKLWEERDLEAYGMPGVTIAQAIDASVGAHDPQTLRNAFFAQYHPQPGGSIGMASGQTGDGTVNPAGSPMQASVRLVRALIDSCANMMDWMVEKIEPYGVKMGPVEQFGTNGMMFPCSEASEAGGYVARAKAAACST